MFKNANVRNLVSGTVLLASVGIGFVPGLAHASDGTVNITGSVTASTCQVNGQAVGVPDTKTVPLPPVSTGALKGIGTVAGATPFSIVLSNCAAGLTQARTYFEYGPNVDVASMNLKTALTGVQVQLLNADDGSVIKLGQSDGNQNSHIQPIDATAHSATLPYAAQYYATAATVSAGSVSTSVTYSIAYP